MEANKQFHGLDLLKAVLAILVAARHMIQVFYPEDSRWRLVIGAWLSNLAVPVFFIMAGFFLFRKVEGCRKRKETELSAEAEKNGKNSELTERDVVLGYCGRILKLYLLWCVIYLPIDWYNWYHGTSNVKEGIRSYVHSLLFSSSIAQRWYLPALIVACLLVWICYRGGMDIWQIFIMTGILFVMGCIGDNWYFNQQLPIKLQNLLHLYCRYFLTMRNGVFYGSFYVCMGLWFAKTKRHIPLCFSAAAFMGFLWVMYLEVRHCSSTNMVFSAAPAAYCLFETASAVKWKECRRYLRLREMSEWIYLSHFYFFYFFSWTAKWNPVPFTEGNMAIMILLPIILFSWFVARLAELEKFRWLKKLI